MNKQSFLLLLFLTCQTAVTAQQKSVLSVTPTKMVDEAGLFIGVFAKVKAAGRYYYIDTAGNYMFDNAIFNRQSVGEEQEEKITETLPNGELPSSFFVEKKGKYGVMNKIGKYILQPEWDMIVPGNRKTFRVKRNNLKGYTDSAGKLLLPRLYEDVFYLDNEMRYYAVKDKMWGIYDSHTKNMLFQFEYNDIDFCGGCPHAPDYFLAQKNTGWGVVAFDKRIIAPFKYQHEHSNMRADYWEASLVRNKKNILIDLYTGREFGPPAYEEITVINQNLFKAVNSNGKYVIVKRNGERITGEFDAIYDEWYFANNHSLIMAEKNGKQGLLDSEGHIIADFIYNETMIFNDSVYAVKRQGKWGIMTSDKKMLTPFEYSEVNDSYLPFVVLKKGPGYVVFNCTNNTTIATVFEAVEKMTFGNEGFVLKTTLDGRVGIIGNNNKVLVAHEYEQIREVYGYQLLIAEKNGLAGMITIDGKAVVPFLYDDISIENNGQFILAQKGGDIQVYNLGGQIFFKSAFTYAEHIKDEIFLLKSNRDSVCYSGTAGKTPVMLPYTSVDKNGSCLKAAVNDTSYVLLHANGTRLTGQVYNKIGTFSNGLAYAQKGTSFGFLDENGKEAIPFQYSYVSDFNNGIAKVYFPEKDTENKFDKTRDHRYSFIDTSGRHLFNINLADYPINNEWMKDSFIILRNGVLQGLGNTRGQLLIQPEYESILLNKSETGGFIANRNNLFYIYNSKGVLVNSRGVKDIGLKYANTYLSEVEFQFPLLFLRDEVWGYLLEDGRELEIKAKTGIINTNF